MGPAPVSRLRRSHAGVGGVDDHRRDRGLDRLVRFSRQRGDDRTSASWNRVIVIAIEDMPPETVGGDGDVVAGFVRGASPKNRSAVLERRPIAERNERKGVRGEKQHDQIDEASPEISGHRGMVAALARPHEIRGVIEVVRASA